MPVRLASLLPPVFNFINNKILSGCHSLADLRRAARRRLPRAVFDYMDGAAEDEVTLRRNQADFAHYELLPHFLTDVGNIDLSVRALGADLDVPFMLAPTGMSRLFHHTGEKSVARAAHKARTMYSLSSVATTSIEDIARVSAGPKMLQLYVWRDRGILKDFIQRAKASGYTALCLTVDLPLAGQRERDLRNGFTVPPQDPAVQCPRYHAAARLAAALPDQPAHEAGKRADPCRRRAEFVLRD